MNGQGTGSAGMDLFQLKNISSVKIHAFCPLPGCHTGSFCTGFMMSFMFLYILLGNEMFNAKGLLGSIF